MRANHSSRGIINTWGVFQTFYEEQALSSYTPSQIAWIGSIQSSLLLLVGAITGPLFDAGYFTLLLLVGNLSITFGLMMTSIATEYWHFILAQGFLVGIGAGCLFVPSVAILPQYFKKLRALANGVAATGSGIGGVVYPIMFRQLQEQVGFAWATRVVGFLVFATCGISLSVMGMRIFPKEKRALFDLSAFRDVSFLLCCSALFFGFLGFYNFVSYVQPWAIENGIVDNNLGFYLVPILNAASVFGRVTPNFIADHTGPVNMLFPAALTGGILAFCWIAVNSTAGIVVLTILYGFCSGGYVSLPAVVVMTITKDMRYLGTRLGMCFAITSIALLVGIPIGGAFLNSSSGYLGVQIFCGTCLLFSACWLAALRFYRTGFVLLGKT